MSRSLTIAAVQMDASPAPTGERLRRADRLVAEAAASGARLVVLPELFNSGYIYGDSNYERAEPLDGPTASWMRLTARRYGVHLAGSLLLLDRTEIFNALLLVAPGGRTWRYDKNFPWGWERAYFRGARETAVAETELGRVGMLVCWDTAHAGLWRRYSGRVELMLIASCPPNVGDPIYRLPGGEEITHDQLGPIFRSLKTSGPDLFGTMVDEQVAWLGVPAVQTVGCGQIVTGLPRPSATLLAMLPFAPRVARHLLGAGRTQLLCSMVEGCKVLDSTGRVVAARAQAEGEGLALGTVTLPDAPPTPRGLQPPARLPSAAYAVSDALLPWLMRPAYRRGVRRSWGRHMAHGGAPGRLIAAAALALGIGALVLRRRACGGCLRNM